MFNQDFYPTPDHIIEMMVEKVGELHGILDKVVLEPSAGKGNIVNFVKPYARQVLAFEKEPDLRKILEGTCNVMGDDFLNCKKHEVSHVEVILMNPPFSEQNKHIQHAINIAPPGCEIVCLCNASLVTNNNPTLPQQTILTYIRHYGYFDVLGNVFSDAERRTNVQVAMLYMKVPPDTYSMEFEGFFMEDTDVHSNTEGVMKYDFIRDIVNRYVEGVKLYDKVLQASDEIKRNIGIFYTKQLLAFAQTEARDSFKKEAQKAAWMHIFNMLNMNKFMTQNMKEQINKFVETQVQVPFTMKNIYIMLDIVIQTTGQRMDKAMEEAFNKITMHTKENRFGVEGWATNKDYVLTKRFIVNGLGDTCRIMQYEKVRVTYSYRHDDIDDLVKTLCYITGTEYNKIPSLYSFVMPYWRRYYESGEPVIDKDGRPIFYSNEHGAKYDDKNYANTHTVCKEYAWGEWFEWAFFRVRVYKKGTAHFEFLDENVWATFNQNIARIKGLVLPKQQKQKKRKSHSTQ